MFEEPLISDSHGGELVGVTTSRVERGRYGHATIRVAGDVCEELPEPIATGQHADAGHMGVVDLDETDRLGRAGEVQDQSGRLLPRHPLLSIEHGDECLRDIHRALLAHHRQST